MDTALVLEWVIKWIALIVILLAGFAYLTYMERKFLGRFELDMAPIGLALLVCCSRWQMA